MQLSKRDPDTPADKGLKRDVEALLFASGKPIAVETLTTAVSQVRPVDAEQLRARSTSWRTSTDRTGIGALSWCSWPEVGRFAPTRSVDRYWTPCLWQRRRGSCPLPPWRRLQ